MPDTFIASDVPLSLIMLLLLWQRNVFQVSGTTPCTVVGQLFCRRMQEVSNDGISRAAEGQCM